MTTQPTSLPAIADDRDDLRSEIAELKNKLEKLMKSEESKDPLRSTAETARQLGTTPSVLSVRRCLGGWDLKWVKRGRRVFYRQSAIDAHIASLREHSKIRRTKAA